MKTEKGIELQLTILYDPQVSILLLHYRFQIL